MKRPLRHVSAISKRKKLRRERKEEKGSRFDLIFRPYSYKKTTKNILLFYLSFNCLWTYEYRCNIQKYTPASNIVKYIPRVLCYAFMHKLWAKVIKVVKLIGFNYFDFNKHWRLWSRVWRNRWFSLAILGKKIMNSRVCCLY